jgi:hypothetical protein
MFLRNRLLSSFPSIVLFAAILSCDSTTSLAQDSGVNLALHANSHASAADIGLPAYPGATLYKNPDSDAAVDLGFTFGEVHFKLMAANYLTSDSPAQVLAFYRKPLSHYGEVLECNHGKPVGALGVARGGLTCSDPQANHVRVNGSADSSDDHEMRSGTPNEFRIVGIDESHTGSTHFGLVYLELPKGSVSDGKSK